MDDVLNQGAALQVVGIGLGVLVGVALFQGGRAFKREQLGPLAELPAWKRRFQEAQRFTSPYL